MYEKCIDIEHIVRNEYHTQSKKKKKKKKKTEKNNNNQQSNKQCKKRHCSYVNFPYVIFDA